ncbi:MAG TPA: hypothetical protein VL426_06555 [Candidatus Binatia bacterium]|nr:hypothetical protein [Candidatus Binatia bacterium]
MRGPEMYGGMPPEEMGMKPESKEDKEAIEMMPYDELLTNVGEQMNKVVRTLDEERKLAGEIRGLGGKVTRDTAERIMGLEKQKNDLLQVYTKTLEPVRKEAFEAFLDRQELLVEEPENLKELMTDPETLEVTDDMIIETQTAGELADLEKELSLEADKASEEMADLIEAMHEAKAQKTEMPDLGDPELRKGYMGILESRYNDLKERLKYVNDDEARAEMKEIDAKLLPMMAEDIEALVARDKAEAEAKMRDMHVAMLQARFNELHNYVRGINDRLKDVRVNLGFARKMDEREGRAAA